MSRTVPHTAANFTSLPAAIYCRVSTREQSDRGFSLPTQREACDALALREGLHVPLEYHFSEDYTGLSLKRPQLMQIRTLIQTRQIQALIVHDADRLSRKLAHSLLLEEELAEHGVALRIVTAPTTDNSPEGSLMAHVRGAVAEYELLKFKERARRGRLGRAKEGYVPGGRVALGYVYVKHAKRGACYVIVEEEAAIVRRIFHLYVEMRLSQEAIAALFTQEGVPTPYDFRPHLRRRLSVRVWHQSTVAAILRNRTYVGTLNTNTRTAIAGKTNPDKKTRWQALPQSEWIPVEVPPLINQELFDAAQQLKKQHLKQSSRNRKPGYLFINGRLRCGQCGSAMSGSQSYGRVHYMCGRKRYLELLDPHSKKVVMGTAIEEPVWHDVMTALRNPAKIELALDHLREQVGDTQTALDQERAPYVRQLAKCNREAELAEAAYFAEAMDLPAYKRKLSEIALRRESAEQELARLDSAVQDVAHRAEYTDALNVYCQRVSRKIAQFTAEEKQHLFEMLDVRVTWHPDKPYTIRAVFDLAIANNSVRRIDRSCWRACQLLAQLVGSG
jgi:site-specific DNA recombinase